MRVFSAVGVKAFDAARRCDIAGRGMDMRHNLIRVGKEVESDHSNDDIEDAQALSLS